MYELQPTYKVLFTNLWMLMIFLYGLLVQSNRLIIIMLFVLFASCITTSIYYQHMQSNIYVIEKVLKYLKLFDIKDFYCKEQDIFMKKETNPAILYEYTHYIIKLQDICTTIIRHMRDNSCNRQIQHSIALVRSIGTRLHSQDCSKNIGFLTGLGIVPVEINSETKIEDIIVYLARLFADVKRLIATQEPYSFTFWSIIWVHILNTFRKMRSTIHRQYSYYTPSPKPDREKNTYYRFVILGMYFALYPLVHSINTSPVNMPQYDKPFNMLCNQFESYVSHDQVIQSLANDMKQYMDRSITISIDYANEPISTVFKSNNYLSLSRLFQQIYCDETL